MIIVKTKNGDHFINEKAVTEVTHDREHATASYYGANGCFNNIADVEGIIYTNDAQPTSWKDEGSEIQRLMKSLDEQREWGNKMRDEYLKIEQEQAETKWKSVDEWPKDGEPILMKLDNGKYQYSEWEEDGKGFNEGFAEINFGSGAMMCLPITYKVVAWRPLADIISELK